MRKKRTVPINLIKAFIFVGFTLCISIFFFSSYKNRPLNRKDTDQTKITIKPTHIAILNPTLIQTQNWETYTNDKFGFIIKYPNFLNLTAEEYALGSDPVLFNYGDMQPPKWIILMQDSEKINYIKIAIYSKPITSWGSGGVEHNKFTFIVDSKIQSQNNLDNNSSVKSINILIQNSIRFINSKYPLECLWINDNNEQQTKYYQQQDQLTVAAIFGYYYDKISNSCKYLEAYIWKGQEYQESPPFKNIESCKSRCVKF